MSASKVASFCCDSLQPVLRWSKEERQKEEDTKTVELQEPDVNLVAVEDEDARLLLVLAFSLQQHGSPVPHVHMQELHLHPTLQGQGLASCIISRLKDMVHFYQVQVCEHILLGRTILTLSPICLRLHTAGL